MRDLVDDFGEAKTILTMLKLRDDSEGDSMAREGGRCLGEAEFLLKAL
jgi:hypothetical protein